jgi:hypothetical protein
MNKLDVFDLLTKEELEQVTNTLLDACSRNDITFDGVFEPILNIYYE